MDTSILDPRDTYADPAEWDKKAQDLASRFIKNFAKYTTNEARQGPGGGRAQARLKLTQKARKGAAHAAPLP